MFDFLKSIVWSLFRRVIARSSAETDNLALRHQVAVLQRQILHRPKLTRWDRLLFAALYRVLPDVLRSISIVRPETVVRWHRAGFRLFWKHKSRGGAGRPRVPGEVRALIRKISIANPLWGAPRIHGELLKLGIDVLSLSKIGSGYKHGWDTATSTGEHNDYSVCTMWLVSKPNYYLIDVLRIRLEFPALRKRIIAHAQKHRANTVLIEDAGLGKPMLQDLRTESRNGMPRPIGIKPDGDKVVRMEAQSAKIEAGRVYLPADASWLDAFLHELLAFPNSRHDDQVDSVSQFLKWTSRRSGAGTGTIVGPKLVTLHGVFGSTLGPGF